MSLSIFPPIVADDWRPQPATKDDPLDVVREYHERTKHRPDRYARGPETLDWDAVPAAFRRFEGASVVRLARRGDLADRGDVTGRSPRRARGVSRLCPLSVTTIGVLLEHCLGITAWKREGPDRWAVRANPSSGNLHPVEGYVLTRSVAGLADGVHYYQAEEHALARRASWEATVGEQPAPRAWVALTAILWREAWKYGERAFRYTELDVGHAIAAVEHAAALFGWSVREERHVGWATLAQALGTGRGGDYPATRLPETEHEEPEVLLELEAGTAHAPIECRALREWSSTARFHGRATTVDRHPMYSWPIVLDVARATRAPDRNPEKLDARSERRVLRAGSGFCATSELIRRRRSARRFDTTFVLDPGAFSRMLAPLHVKSSGPLAARSGEGEPALELVLFVHRVQSLAPGVYLLPRGGDAPSSLLAALGRRFDLRRVRGKARGTRDGFELLELASAPPRDLMRAARLLHCHQEIAATCAFSIAMIADLEASLTGGASAYRRLHREAGRIGQTLYLAAEAEGLGGTGIGCFFDDAVLELVGLAGGDARSIYHFAIGLPLDDPRIVTEPAESSHGDTHVNGAPE